MFYQPRAGRFSTSEMRHLYAIYDNDAVREKYILNSHVHTVWPIADYHV
jgi:hypothetical protein